MNVTMAFNLRAIFICLGLSLPVSVFAAENLWDIYQKAILNDPGYRAQQFNSQADKEFIEQATSALKPYISASLNAGRIHTDSTSTSEFLAGQSTYNNKSATLSLSQTLWDKTKFKNVKRAKNRVRLSDIQVDIAHQNLLLRVASRYFGLLAAQDGLDVAQSEVSTLKNQFERAEDLLDAGLGTSTDYYQSLSRFELAHVDVLNARRLITDARQALAEITGDVVAELAKPGSDYPITDPEPFEWATWLDITSKNNPQLAAAHQQIDIAKDDIEIAKSGRLPSLNLNADQTYSDNDGGINGANDSTQSRLMLELSAPLYQGGQVKSKTREAANRYNASLQNFATMMRSIERQTLDAYNKVITSKNQVSALQKSVQAAETVFQARQRSFESGLSTNVEVLDSTRDLYSAQRNLLKARYDYINNTFSLKSLAGILSETDFKAISTLLID